MTDSSGKKSKVTVWHRPDWHPSLSTLLGNIEGTYGYVTEVGTIKLLGPYYDNPDVSKYSSESKTKGPITSVNAKGQL